MRPLPARPRLLATVLILTAYPVLQAVPSTAAWSPNGNPVCTAAGAQTSPTSVTDGAGGMIVTWLDARPDAPGVYAQRLLGDGTIAPGWPADGVLCSGLSTGGTPFPVPDAAGGVLVLWYSAGVISGQRVDGNGALHAGWPADAKVIAPNEQTMDHGFAAVSDGASGRRAGPLAVS